MNKDKYVFSQLVTFLDEFKFLRIVKKYEGNKYIKSYTCWNQLLTVYCSVPIEIILDGQRNAIQKWRFRMNGHSCAFLLLEVFRLFPESEGVSGDVFEDVLGIGEVTRGAFVGIRKRVHLMPNLKGSPATDNCNRDIILKKVS